MRNVIAYDGTSDSVTLYTDGDKDRARIALKYILDAQPGEPLMCIRGRDLLAVPAITAYLGLTAGLVLNGPVQDAILADIAAVQSWQAKHPNMLKYPDRPTPGTIRAA